MPSKDVIHGAVRNALIKDGWTIVADPYTIAYGRQQVFADLCAERQGSSEATRMIVVEVKSFRGQSSVHEFQQALGQYISYRDLLGELGQQLQVYLAISSKAHEDVFGLELVMAIARRERLKLLVVDTESEVVSKWIELTNSKDIIKRLLRERERIACPFMPAGLELATIFDDDSGFYELVTVGWMMGKRVCGPTLLLRVKDGKIWIEDDETDAAIADDLVDAGVSEDEIVLGFQPAEMRPHTEFATA